MPRPHWFFGLLIACAALALPAFSAQGDTGAAAEGWLRIGQGALLVDVRSAEEFEAGHIDGSVNLPHTDIDDIAEMLGPDLDRPAVLYCGSGRRAGIALEALQARGYTAIFNASGYEALKATQP